MALNRTRMPPFAGLLAFDATLRHGSMTVAGDELGLTQSAVSHRIRALESFFETALLERLNPGLRTTEAGTRLAREIAPLLRALGGLQHQIANPSAPRNFRLGLSSSLFAHWLSVRLPALGNAFPDIFIEILTWDTTAEAMRSEVDLSLLWLPAAEGQGGQCEMPFPTESVFPVASPKILQSRRPDSDWRSLPLLAKGRRGEETGREWSWSTWLRKSPSHEAMRFRDIGSSLQAAINGSGVALGRTLLVADALQKGRLVGLVGTGEAYACTKSQFARWLDPQDGTAQRMAMWLVAAASDDMVASERFAEKAE